MHQSDLICQFSLCWIVAAQVQPSDKEASRLVHQLLPSLSEREKGASHLKYTIEADA